MTTDSLIEVTIPDLNRVQAEIRRASKKGSQEAAKVATRKMALLFKKELKARTPLESGNLRRSMRHSVRKAKKFTGYLGKVGLIRRRRSDKDYPFYAYFLEKGTKAHKIPRAAFDDGVYSGVEHPGIEARPFFNPTFKDRRGAAVRLGSRTFIEQIRKYIR